MTAYLVRRFAQFPVVLLLVTLFLFVIMRAIPGDPVYAMMGEPEESFDREALAAMREDLGLDQPLPVQYVDWLADLARGDLGSSFLYRQPVHEQLIDRVPVTAQVGLLSVGLAVLIGIPCGTIAAVKRNSPIDMLVTVVAMFGIAVPNFWFALLLIWVFVVWLGMLPATGFTAVWENPVDAFRTMAMPVTALGLTLSAAVMRHTRSSVLDVLHQDHVRTARAKGLPGGLVVTRHTLRNALLPVVTIIGVQLGTVLAGSIVIESIFALPGLGRLTIEAINGRDYPMVQGVVLLFTFMVLLVNLLTDLSYAILDPRIRYG